MNYAFDVGSAIAGALGLGSSFFGNSANVSAIRDTNRTNLQIARETNQANLDLYNKQFADQYKLWQDNNLYNDPSNQMARLRNAGLNPSLIMQNGGLGNATAASAPSANAMIGATMQAPLNNYSDVSANMASVANAVKSLSEAKGQTISNSFAEQMAMKDLALKQAEIDIALEKTKVGTETWKKLKEEKRVVELNADMLFETFNARKENFDLQNDVLRANKSMMEESGKQMAADAAYKDSLTALNNIRAQFEPQALRSTIAQLMSYVTLNGSLANLNDKQADKVVLEKFNEMAKNVGLKLDNTQKYTIMPYITKQAKEAARGAKIENDWKPLRYGAEVIEKGAKA